MQHIREHEFADVLGMVSEMRSHRLSMVQTEVGHVTWGEGLFHAQGSHNARQEDREYTQKCSVRVEGPEALRFSLTRTTFKSRPRSSPKN